jgi:preprotein translocase subunit Sec61beta
MTEPVKELAEETERGTSERTPWLALSGVTVVVGAFVAVVVAAALILYYVI